MSTTLPQTQTQLHSLVTPEGELQLSLADVALDAPGPDQVVVRVEATPINPSDLGMLFAGGDADASLAAGDGMYPGVSLPVSAHTAASSAGHGIDIAVAARACETSRRVPGCPTVEARITATPSAAVRIR